jgi:hypothetical protein
MDDVTREAGRDFDFFIGEWEITHRRLSRRLVGDDNWIEFKSLIRVVHILGGLGNLDESVVAVPGQEPYPAATLRLFNRLDGKWYIYWIDSRDPVLDVPLVGDFTDGIGTFLAEEEFEGRPIQVRFIWTATDPDSPRWEQAFSEDGGETWETNWTMTYVR